MGFISKMFGNKKDKDSEPVLPNREDSALEESASNTVDVNKPVENPKLKRLLNQMNQENTDAVMSAVFEEIAMNAQFLSVIMLSEEPEKNGNGTSTFKKDTVMQFPMLTAQDDSSFYPVFTDWLELGKWQAIQEPKTLILSFDDYVAMVLKDERTSGIVINPFSDNMVINRQLVEYLKTRKDMITKGVSQQVMTKDTEVLLGEPKNYPEEMLQAISDHLKGQPNVSRVWLRLMQKENQQSFLLVVDFLGERESVFQGIAQAANPYLGEMYLDMVPYQDGFGKNAVKNIKPFYQK